MTETGWAIVDQTDIIADYLLRKFGQNLPRGLTTTTNVEFPEDWSPDFLMECDQAALILAQAYSNGRRTAWRAEAYARGLTTRCTGQNEHVEGRIKRLFPPIHSETRLEIKPMLVTDCEGKIVLWYLPGILTAARQGKIWAELKILEPSLQVQANSSSWRLSPKYYYRPTSEKGLQPGTVSISPAWFQQAHEKCNTLEVSAELNRSHALEWLRAMRTSSALLGALLKIMHPKLYAAGKRCFRKLHENPERVSKGHLLHEVLTFWSAPFTGLSVIANRQTPLHRDNGAQHGWFDLLLALGEYQNGRFELPGLGLRLRYQPGTVLGLAGRVLQHGAKCIGDRACISYYMKEAVVTALGEDNVGWAHISDLL